MVEIPTERYQCIAKNTKYLRGGLLAIFTLYAKQQYGSMAIWLDIFSRAVLCCKAFILLSSDLQGWWQLQITGMKKATFDNQIFHPWWLYFKFPSILSFCRLTCGLGQAKPNSAMLWHIASLAESDSVGEYSSKHPHINFRDWLTP